MINMVLHESCGSPSLEDEFFLQEAFLQGGQLVKAGGWLTPHPDCCIQDLVRRPGISTKLEAFLASLEHQGLHRIPADVKPLQISENILSASNNILGMPDGWLSSRRTSMECLEGCRPL